ncbi:M1 family metallopeptidase [Terrimonas sp. NA20]|uniref:M1 family metallopeptidase n=1 Tax=Terrimonas ginsenosidimutans TaxID=2908004 RepID=A0ABS9KY52_9BACT|nr:M1 family metallopeptidase [Terrimonas ginsenosidimutans]MCG2617236.1 M1 family metallopeptidase [Terrimonas ginsenosidimutans]
MKTFATVLFLLFISLDVFSQYTHQDTLRGSVTPERAWWDVTNYKIAVTPDYAAKTIKGSSRITYKISGNVTASMQIDLQQPMQLDSVFIGTQRTKLSYQRDGNVFYIQLPAGYPNGLTADSIELFYSGKPREAVNPPWDGGWIWKKDPEGRPWMSVACQGLGASVWYPCKDYQGDEPENGASLSMTVADPLSAISNGRLKEKRSNGDGTTTWTWAVVNPINNYNIVPYIGYYTNWKEDYAGVKGNLECSYWVLEKNIDKAKAQFGRDVKRMLKCFEEWFGPYPFYEDSYKLVEAPHLGMEHQSAVAYGNKYMNGYLGMDLSGSGWGREWDYIIVHESGHEWFANNITTQDIADMWIHEGFTTYSEVVFVECNYGKKAADEYCQGLRKSISNDSKVIGPYGVNKEGSGDMYPKGANLIHTIRQIIDNEKTFKDILKGLNKDFYHKITTSKEVEEYISRKSGKDLSKVFDQYLRDTRIPVLEYKIENDAISYRWRECIAGFNMPVRIYAKNKAYTINATENWQTLSMKQLDEKEFSVDKNFYIHSSKSDYVIPKLKN